MKKRNLLSNAPQKWGNIKNKIIKIAQKHLPEVDDESDQEVSLDELEVPLNLTIFNQYTKINYPYPEMLELTIDEILSQFEEEVDLSYSLWDSNNPDIAIQEGLFKEYKIIEEEVKEPIPDSQGATSHQIFNIEGINHLTRMFLEHIKTQDSKIIPGNDSRYIQILEREKDKLEQNYKEEKVKLETEIKDLKGEIKDITKEYQSEINRLKEKITELQLLTITNSKTGEEYIKIQEELEKVKKELSGKDKKISEYEKQKEIREIENKLKIKKDVPDEFTEKTRQVFADKLPDILDAGIA
ncbi:MAG: hypothetical protein KDK36_10025, partial [Leptospiraceae bacterium]|nr:hypothetical protein [Leptospiraceae bacterium]